MSGKRISALTAKHHGKIRGVLLCASIVVTFFSIKCKKQKNFSEITCKWRENAI